MAESQNSPQVSKESIKQLQIDWEDFNYPPYLNLFHYNMKEIKDEQERKVVTYISASFYLSLFSLAINFTNAIACTIGGDDQGRIIFYSFLHFTIFSPISLYVFYHGYKSVVSDKTQIQNYLWEQLFCAICYFIFSIVKGGAFDGFIKASYLFNANLRFQAILSLAESLSYLCNSIYSLYIIYQVKKLQNQQTTNQEKFQSNNELQL
ncbi:hypothetical protein ABPG74_011617 [Tetrahymena malaccensis]